MKTATGLTAIALGAVLAFAVDGHPWFLNLQAADWIIILLGVAGLVVPRRGCGWMRRQMVLRLGPDGQPVARFRRRVPPYVMIDQAAAAAPAAAPVPGGMPETADEEIVEEYLTE